MNNEVAPLALALAAVLYAAIFRRKISGSTSTTALRLAWATPAVAVLTLSTLLYDTGKAGVTLGIHGWVFSWAGSSSIVGVAIQTSPLSADASFTAFLAHLLLLCVPFDPKKRPGAEAQSIRSLVTRLIVAGTLCTLLFAPLLHEVAAGNWGPHPVLEIVVDCGVLWTLLEMIFAVQAMACYALGIRTEPSMQSPLASISLREFWARRWNIPTSIVLRSTCYDPVLRALAPKKNETQHAAGHADSIAVSTSAHSSQHANGACCTGKATASPETSNTQSHSRYNLRSRAGADSANSKATSTASSTPVATNGKSVASNGNSGAGGRGTPADVLRSFPVPADSDSPGDGSAAKMNGSTRGKGSGSGRVAVAKTVGSCLAFFVSGVAHHCIIHLLSRTPLDDMRFALLFWIQPPIIALQDAWTGSSWWRSVQCKQPVLARLTQWVSTLVLFLFPMWYLMRNPFLDNSGGRAFVLKATSEVATVCKVLLPSPDAICGTSAPVIKMLDAAADLANSIRY